MKLIQGGFPKSGNYWLYKIIDLILHLKDIKRKRFIHSHPIYPLARQWELSYPEQVDIDMIDIFYQGVFFRISSAFRRKIEDFSAYLEKTSQVWTHSDFCEKSKVVFPLFDKRIYIIRDPRDVALSTAKFAFTPYMKKYYPTFYSNESEYLEHELQKIVSDWSRHVMEYIENANYYDIHIIFYERLKEDFSQTLDELLNYLQIDLSRENKEFIAKETNFNNLKDQSPWHLNKGNYYRWKEKLDTRQQTLALETAEPVLDWLNYPLTYFKDDRIPRLPLPVAGSKLKNVRKKLNRKTIPERFRLIKEAIT
ncbi:MAG: sulfotransferase domain-containing protein [Candidatus Cyclobacteriaceae bacterium M3_2C_046]